MKLLLTTMPKKYISENAELMKEWNWERNKDLGPNRLSMACAIKVWWKCSKCGYEWKTAINKRTYRKHGCLNCSGQVAFPGVNDLATLYPEVAKEWHPTKNAPLTPREVRPKSNKKYWWKCTKCGHDWQASGSSRIGHQSGCPACAGRVPKTGINDLFTICPHLKREWDFEKNKHLNPSMLSKGSHTKAWWKCTKGHSYEMTIQRKSAGAGCPYCSSHRVLIGFNDFKTAFPNLAKEWDLEGNNGKSPDMYTVHSNQKVWWLCPKGHKYEMSITARASGGTCPYCSNHKLLVGYNDLKTLYPELALEWNYEKNGILKPTDIIPKTKKKVWWTCSKCKHIWQTSVIERVYGSGCPQCLPERKEKNLRQKIRQQGMGIKDPTLLQEWDYKKNKNLRPEEYSSHSNKKVWWICPAGHNYQATIDKKSSGQGCPICSNHQLLIGSNDLQTRFPNIAKEWNFEKNENLTPSQVIATSTKKVWWICSICHSEWQTKILFRTKKGTGCPVCGAKKRAESHRASFIQKNGCLTEPLLLKEWNFEKNYPLQPQDFPPSSNKFAWWTCSKCGYEWKAKIANRRLLKRGCPCCANHIAVKGKNDLATTHPQLAKEWHPTKNTLRPDMVVYGTAKKVWWICPKGHEYQATILHRAHGTNCPVCNSGRQTSFAEQAVFYYVRKIFPDAINRYKDIFSNGMELDIYIPSIKIAIEYDGIFYHKREKLQREMKKYDICKKHHIKLLRLKEADITQDKEQCQTADCVFHVPGLGDTKKALDKAIRLLLANITAETALFPSYVYAPMDINTERDKYDIRSYMTERLKNSITHLRPDLSKEWHPTKNGHFKPSMVSLHSNRKAWWVCSTCGNEYETSVSHRVNGTGCPKCGIEKSTQAKRKAVEMLDINTNEVIRGFISISDAGRKMHINSSNISMVCKGLRPNAGGYKWRYKA